MIDSHCHLTDPRLGSQLADVLARAKTAGVSRLITISTTVDDARACIAVAAAHEQIACSVGVHPNYAHEQDLSRTPELADLCKSTRVVALGEMGLDYHYGSQHKAVQREAFEQQLHIATQVALPVVIHCREAVDDTLAILAAFPAVPCVFHCFTGTTDEARRILDAGHLLGFTGAITFKKSDALRDVVRVTPNDRLLIETDAPYLTPEPMRKQKVNEPALVTHVAATVAHVKNLPLQEVDRLTTQNAQRFFRWA